MNYSGLTLDSTEVAPTDGTSKLLLQIPWPNFYLLNPSRTKSSLWPVFEVWAGHCGCNICP